MGIGRWMWRWTRRGRGRARRPQQVCTRERCICAHRRLRLRPRRRETSMACIGGRGVVGRRVWQRRFGGGRSHHRGQEHQYRAQRRRYQDRQRGQDRHRAPSQAQVPGRSPREEKEIGSLGALVSGRAVVGGTTHGVRVMVTQRQRGAERVHERGARPHTRKQGHQRSR